MDSRGRRLGGDCSYHPLFGSSEFYISVLQKSGDYPLVMTNIAMGNGPFIDGLPSYKMVISHGYVK